MEVGTGPSTASAVGKGHSTEVVLKVNLKGGGEMLTVLQAGEEQAQGEPWLVWGRRQAGGAGWGSQGGQSLGRPGLEDPDRGAQGWL